MGNFLYYYRQANDVDIGIEILDDYDKLIEQGLLADTTGLIAVGDGVPNTTRS